MRRATRREDRRHRGNLFGIGLLLLSAAAISALLGYRVCCLPEPLGTDNCPPPAPAGLQAILIDSTDALTEAQRIDVRNRLISFRESLPVGWAVQVWRVAPSAEAVPQPLGPIICKPDPSPNPFTTNRREGLRRYHEFEETVQALFDTALSSMAEPQSPILEAIQAIGLRFFQDPRYENVQSRRILIVSDLIQNTAAISHIPAVPSFDRFRATEAYTRLRIELAHVRVTVLYLSRPGAETRAGHIEWWQRLFADYHAVLERVERVSG